MPEERKSSLKRFLGLKGSKKATPFHKGGIDNVQPGRLSGWVVVDGIDLHEVRLLVGNHLLAKADINQPRADVCEMLGWKGQPGFMVELPSALPMVNWQDEPRLIAMSVDGSLQVELGLLDKQKRTGDVLKNLLQSDLLGLIGHCDGMVQGAIRGWAARNGQSKPATIWLQSECEDAIAVLCDQHREGMQSQKVPSQCGFVVPPQSVPSAWAGLDVWFSFDRDGEYRLPQAAAIVLPGGRLASGQGLALKTASPTTTVVMTESYVPMAEGAPQELAEHWQRLEEFRQYLDQVERQLKQIDQLNVLQSKTDKQKGGKKRKPWLPGTR